MTEPVLPTATGGKGQVEEHAGVNAGGSSGIHDSQHLRYKAQLIRIACDIAAIAQRYQKIHHALFGFSVHRVLHALQPGKHVDFAALEVELDAIEAESANIQHDFNNADFNDLPKHAKTIITIRDALRQYTKAVRAVTSKLNHICRSLRQEGEGEMEFTNYSKNQFQRDKAAYDACLQEFRRWGVRLTELFEKF